MYQFIDALLVEQIAGLVGVGVVLSGYLALPHVLERRTTVTEPNV
jgi:hypothetical protein